MEIVNTVIKTKEYSKFKFIKGNRKVNVIHVKRLKTSFERNYLISPIIVNENFEIIDGQHRFTAAKELNIPVYYIVIKGYSHKEIKILNTNGSNWKKQDYLEGYINLGYQEYIVFKNFMNEYPDFNITDCEVILTQYLGGARQLSLTKNKTYSARDFENGNLQIPNLQHSREIANKIMLIKPLYDGFNRRVFVKAMVGIFKIKGYSHNKFLKKLNSNRAMMYHCSNVTQYKLLIENIYNYRSKNKVSLRF